MPPHNQVIAAGTPNQGTVDEVENPNPLPGTNNWYTEDGYGGGSYGSPSYGGGSYSECADISQPGIRSVVDYLQSLPRPVDPNCQPDRYYLLNNYNPGYFGDGTNAYALIGNPSNTVFTVPPSRVKNIGNVLLKANVSFAYFGDQFDRYLQDPYLKNPEDLYCNICNFLQYSTSIMTNAAVRTAHLKDTIDLYTDIQNGNLPAVSFVKPSGYVDGHPASSKLDLFEGFVKKIVDGVKANPSLWASTAIFITTDEGGGYYDSGYVQAARLLRRRNPHSDDRGLAVQHRRAYLARLFRPRLGPQIHRGQLAAAHRDPARPRQPAKPEDPEQRPLCAGQFAGDRQSDGSVQLRSRPIVKPQRGFPSRNRRHREALRLPVPVCVSGAQPITPAARRARISASR